MQSKVGCKISEKKRMCHPKGPLLQKKKNKTMKSLAKTQKVRTNSLEFWKLTARLQQSEECFIKKKRLNLSKYNKLCCASTHSAPIS